MSSKVVSGRTERDERWHARLSLDICEFEQSGMLDMSSKTLRDH
jgi:hypothetical protein